MSELSIYQIVGLCAQLEVWLICNRGIVKCPMGVMLGGFGVLETLADFESQRLAPIKNERRKKKHERRRKPAYIRR